MPHPTPHSESTANRSHDTAARSAPTDAMERDQHHELLHSERAPAIKHYCGSRCMSRFLIVCALLVIIPVSLALLPIWLPILLIVICCLGGKQALPPWASSLEDHAAKWDDSLEHTFTSQFITMRDGTKIAIDLYRLSDKKAPVLLHQTRYHRSILLAWPLSCIGPLGMMTPMWKEAAKAGFHCVSVDVRGTGASFGQHAHALSDAERRDAWEVCDWIVAQPWCNGSIATVGISYDGCVSSLMCVRCVTLKMCVRMCAARAASHPAVKAVAPMYTFYDLYNSIVTTNGAANWWCVEGRVCSGI